MRLFEDASLNVKLDFLYGLRNSVETELSPDEYLIEIQNRRALSETVHAWGEEDILAKLRYAGLLARWEEAKTRDEHDDYSNVSVNLKPNVDLAAQLIAVQQGKIIGTDSVETEPDHDRSYFENSSFHKELLSLISRCYGVHEMRHRWNSRTPEIYYQHICSSSLTRFCYPNLAIAWDILSPCKEFLVDQTDETYTSRTWRNFILLSEIYRSMSVCARINQNYKMASSLKNCERTYLWLAIGHWHLEIALSYINTGLLASMEYGARYFDIVFSYVNAWKLHDSRTAIEFVERCNQMNKAVENICSHVQSLTEYQDTVQTNNDHILYVISLMKRSLQLDGCEGSFAEVDDWLVRLQVESYGRHNLRISTSLQESDF